MVMGRPPSLTSEITEKLVHALKMGCPVEYACGYAGISETSYYEWLEKGENGDEQYAHFADTIKECEPAFIMKQLGVIQNASAKEWTAAAWLAERRSPSNFSRNATRLKLKQKQLNGNTEEKLLQLTNEILEQVAAGKMTLEDGKLAAAMIEEQRKVVDTIRGVERMNAMEEQLKNLQLNK